MLSLGAYQMTYRGLPTLVEENVKAMRRKQLHLEGEGLPKKCKMESKKCKMESKKIGATQIMLFAHSWMLLFLFLCFLLLFPVPPFGSNLHTENPVSNLSADAVLSTVTSANSEVMGASALLEVKNEASSSSKRMTQFKFEPVPSWNWKVNLQKSNRKEFKVASLSESYIQQHAGSEIGARRLTESWRRRPFRYHPHN